MKPSGSDLQGLSLLSEEDMRSVTGGMVPFGARVGWQVASRSTRAGDSSLDAHNAQLAQRAAQQAAATQHAQAAIQFQALRAANPQIFNPTLQQSLQQAREGTQHRVGQFQPQFAGHPQMRPGNR